MHLRHLRLPLLALAAGIYLAGCGSLAPRTAETKPAETKPAVPPVKQATVVPPYSGGGYYKDDGPGANPPDNLDAIPDAVPKDEPMHPFANRVYKVKGKRYAPDVTEQPYKTRGLASWYGRKFHGNPTSSGEPYDMYGMTAAHKTLPIPSYARVTNVRTGDSVVVRINDRGPFHPGRVIDLSYTAAYKLDALGEVTLVDVERLLPGEGAAPDSFTAGVNGDGLVGESSTTAALQVMPLPEPLPIQEQGAVGAVYLQLGAFTNPLAADDMTARLMQKLGRVIPGVLRLDEGGLIKVQVGPFTSDEAAEAAREMVAAAVDVKPYKFSSRGAQAPRQSTVSAEISSPAEASLAPTDQAYWLQLAAFSREEAAEALVKRVQSESIVPGVEKRLEAGLTKVQAGPYPSAALADSAAVQLASLLGHRPYRLSR